MAFTTTKKNMLNPVLKSVAVGSPTIALRLVLVTRSVYHGKIRLIQKFYAVVGMVNMEKIMMFSSTESGHHAAPS